MGSKTNDSRRLPTLSQRVASLEAIAVARQQQIMAATEYVWALRAVMIDLGIWTEKEIEKEVRRRADALALADYSHLGLGSDYAAGIAGYLLAMGARKPKPIPRTKPHLHLVTAERAEQ